MSRRQPDELASAAARPGPWRMAGAALSGVLIVLAFPLFGAEVGLDWLVWFALVPLLLAATGQGLRQGLLLGLCTGVILEAAGFLWILLAIRRFTGLPWLVATAMFLAWVLYTAIPWAALGAALGRCSRPSRVLWVLPFWVGIEHCYPRLFPWHLGGALYEREWLLQSVDVWGASGLTALVFLSSVCLYRAVLFVARKDRFPAATAVAFLVLLAGTLVYGVWRLDDVLHREAEAPSIRVALIQGALEPGERSDDGVDYYLEASNRALEQGPVDLVVWPEGAVSATNWMPFDLNPGENARWLRGQDAGRLLAPKVDALGVPLVAGGSGFDASRSPRFSNVLVYVRPGEPPGYYEKNVRLLGGENVPLLDYLPEGMRRKLEHIGTIAAGTSNPVFTLGARSFRSLICYEAILPGYFAQSAREADFLVNITEDIWYGRTAHIPQHFSVLRLRVVENRTPLVRCTNIGPSGVFTPSGRFLGGGKIFEPAEVVTTFGAGRLATTYSAWGRFLPLVLLLIAVARACQVWMGAGKTPAKSP